MTLSSRSFFEMFTNERGNKICMDVIRHKDGSVTIKTEGPTSLHENTLTQKEGRALARLMRDAFPDMHQSD